MCLRLQEIMWEVIRRSNSQAYQDTHENQSSFTNERSDKRYNRDASLYYQKQLVKTSSSKTNIKFKNKAFCGYEDGGYVCVKASGFPLDEGQHVQTPSFNIETLPLNKEAIKSLRIVIYQGFICVKFVFANTLTIYWQLTPGLVLVFNFLTDLKSKTDSIFFNGNSNNLVIQAKITSACTQDPSGYLQEGRNGK